MNQKRACCFSISLVYIPIHLIPLMGMCDPVYRCTADLLLPVHDFCIAPQIFQIVKSAGIIGEEVCYDVDEIGEDPLVAAGVGFGAGGKISFVAEFQHVIADAAHLASAGAGGDDEEIRDRRNR